MNLSLRTPKRAFFACSVGSFSSFFFSFALADNLPPCYNPDTRVIFVTSFHSAWYESMKPKLFSRTIFDEQQPFPQDNLVAYHEDDVGDLIPGVCTFDLRHIPWFEYELMNKNSGLNQYFAFAGFADPAGGNPRPGSISIGHVLFMKVTSIYHAVHNSPENSIVFWVDTDVSFREPIPKSVLDWIRSKDVTYVPFATKNPFLIGSRKPWAFASYNVSDYSHQERLLKAEFWKVESGVFALTVNEKTRKFMSKALRLYRGGMLEFAKECFRKSEYCQTNRVRTNVFLNDIFVFSLLLQSDAHKDMFFHEDLEHGWFAMAGLEPWGENNAVWGAGWYSPNFSPVPAELTVSMVSNFHIGKYVFHHFAYHETGTLAMEFFNRTKERPPLPAWKSVYSNPNKSSSLYEFLLESQGEMWPNEYELPPSRKGGLLLSLPIAYDETSIVGILNIYESTEVSWEEQLECFCDKYTVAFWDCADLHTQILNLLSPSELEGTTSNKQEESRGFPIPLTDILELSHEHGSLPVEREENADIPRSGNSSTVATSISMELSSLRRNLTDEFFEYLTPVDIDNETYYLRVHSEFTLLGSSESFCREHLQRFGTSLKLVTCISQMIEFSRQLVAAALSFDRMPVGELSQDIHLWIEEQQRQEEEIPGEEKASMISIITHTIESASNQSTVPSYHLVVARYKENLDWLTKFMKNERESVFVYDKSGDPLDFAIPRRNIGREVESFLYHIIQHYDNLPEYVVFLQGNPFDHMFTIINEGNFHWRLKLLLSTKPRHPVCVFISLTTEPHGLYPSIKSREYFQLLFEAPIPDRSIFPAGTQLIVPRDAILSKPKQYYAHVHSLLIHGKQLTTQEAENGDCTFDPRAINGWTLERLWGYLFNPRIKPSKAFCRKRYLVTGGAGFIGGHLVRKLAAGNNTVIVLDNLSTGDLRHFPLLPNVQFIQGDILKADDIFLAGIVDGVFHLAAMSKVLPSMKDPTMIDFCTQQNVRGTINVLKYASEHSPPAKVVYSASSTYYGSNPVPHHEGLPPDLQTPYALSKYVGEQYCEMFSRLYSVPTVRLRYFMVYGPNEPENGAYSVVTGVFLKRLRQGDLPLQIHGDGLQTRDFVHVFDVVHATVLAMETSHIVNETINIGTGLMISINQLASLISNDTVHTLGRAYDLRATLCDTAKMERLLQWKPTLRIESYIRSALLSIQRTQL